MSYQYKPLAHPDAEIRVALLQHGAYDDEIHISFQIRSLEVSQCGRRTSNGTIPQHLVAKTMLHSL
jgi:hypothetical protein